MDAGLQAETERLTRSWMRHDAAILQDYLVADVEDPRINVQSIITRHFLVHALFGDRFAALMEHELRFAILMNWLRHVFASGVGQEELPALWDGLTRGADNIEGLEIPSYVRETLGRLPAETAGGSIPLYLTPETHLTAGTPFTGQVSGHTLSVFERIWRAALDKETPSRRSVFEPGCGSANDYRFLETYGLARLLDYTGFDLCEKNVTNARAMFPKARFEVGNAFALPVADRTFDYGFVHDLLEHLSMAGLEQAIGELCRVTRRALSIGFFNMHEEPDHVVRPVEDYHWNTLSMERVRDLFEAAGGAVEVMHVDTYLRWRFGCPDTHNKNAYTFIVHMTEAS